MTEEKSNIIQFPKEHIRPHLIQDIDVNDTKAALLRENANIIAQITSEFILDNFRAAGIDLDLGNSPLCVKEFILSLESLKAVLYKYYGLEHPMQLIAENVFVVDGNLVKYKASQETVSELLSEDEYIDSGL